MSALVDLGTGVSGVLRAFGIEPASRRAARRAQLAEALDGADDRRYWLALAVCRNRLPVWREVVEFRRDVTANGLSRAWRRYRGVAFPGRRAQVVTGVPLVDVHHTALSGLGTGVQRVVRAVAMYLSGHDAVLIGWGTSGERIVELAADRFLARRKTVRGRPIIPWNCPYLLAEVVTDVRRAARIGALTRASTARTIAIGHDAIPLTTAETTGFGMPGAFSRHLAAFSHMDEILTVSRASAREYEGWAAMLPAAGLEPPRIRTVMLAETASEATNRGRDGAARVLEEFGSGVDVPLVLCVGSHEPRKNHDAVLVAAELLWREGIRFSLLFVGGNGWRSDDFMRRCARLRREGYPVASVRGMSDDVLWALYREARFTVFPSLNEGFGLPVAESLHSGTPVVTSRFGSMAEIAEKGGCLLVDPRSEVEIADCMRRLLTDDAELAALRAAARDREERSWDAYSREVADILLA